MPSWWYILTLLCEEKSKSAEGRSNPLFASGGCSSIRKNPYIVMRIDQQSLLYDLQYIITQFICNNVLKNGKQHCMQILNLHRKQPFTSILQMMPSNKYMGENPLCRFIQLPLNKQITSYLITNQDRRQRQKDKQCRTQSDTTR